MHVSALGLRGHKHVAAAARPLRPGRRTDERSTMSATAKKRKQQTSQGFTAEEKAAMRARARELKAAEDGGSAGRAALAAKAAHDREARQAGGELNDERDHHPNELEIRVERVFDASRARTSSPS